MNTKFSNYIVYVDESGDHSLISINQDYPVFVLAFCVFNKAKYSANAVKKIQQFKFNHFGHDIVILHENEIRRDKGEFRFLKTKQLKQDFLNELTQIIEEEDFTIIAAVIDKNKLATQYTKPHNPYDIALRFCLERLHMYLDKKSQGKTHIVFEQRGKKEDNELELEFRRICDGDSFINKCLEFEIIFANKQCNSAGLQLADLVARPIGVNYLKPNQPNRAFGIIQKKLYAVGKRFKGIGLKIFP